MILYMYIHNILIAVEPVDLRGCETFEERFNSVEKLKTDMTEKHFIKTGIVYRLPSFFLIAESRVNVIIKDDLFLNRLVPELEHELDEIRLNEDYANC